MFFNLVKTMDSAGVPQQKPRGLFKEVRGNLWEVPAEVRVITTNGVVKRDGRCVMGRGCALQAARKYPDVPLLLGDLIVKGGNRVHEILQQPPLVSFPVKHKWFEKADLALIRESAAQLVMLADERGWKSIVMPRPGCGNGGRWWLSEVRPILVDILDDRFTIVYDGGSTEQSFGGPTTAE